jgi:uncharacterized membrane protein YraQ (UPF0718 family)
MTHFVHILFHYLKEIIPALAVGFFISGLVHELIPEDMVEKHLGGKGIKPILWSTLIGAILPVCCWGSLPIAVSFYKKGAKLGPILAFLTATPATSISAVIVTYSVLGFNFAAYSFFAVIIMGLVVGLAGNLIRLKPTVSLESGVKPCHCGAKCRSDLSINKAGDKNKEAIHSNKSFSKRAISILSYAFIKLPKEIGLELLVGLLLAAVVATFVPIGEAIHKYLAGWAGYPFSAIFGVLMYICATASPPLIDSLISQGLGKGPGMTLLLIGPVTSYGTILVLRKEFGIKVLALFLALLAVITVLLGIGFSMI